MKKSGIIIFISISLIIIWFFFFRFDRVEYRDIKYEIRYDEYGLMLFRGNAGDFQIREVYDGDSLFLMNMYEHQGRRYLWVKMVDGKLYDVDSADFDLKTFKNIDTREFLDNYP